MPHEWVIRGEGERQDVQDWEHPLVQEMVHTPDNPPKLEVHYGFLGRSPFVNHRRLYTKADFSQWMDILEDMIVHAVKLEQSVSKLGKHVIWIDRKYKEANGYPEGPWYP